MGRKKKRIIEAYLMFDDDDVSTERLLALICDACDCEVDEVIQVLIKEGFINE